MLTDDFTLLHILVKDLTVIVVNRIDREEALMIEQFGDEYRQHMQRTGRFLPRFVK